MSALNSRRLRAPVSVVALAAALMACGGGGDAPEAPAPTGAFEDAAQGQAAYATKADQAGVFVGTGWRSVGVPAPNFFTQARLPMTPGAAPIYVDAVNGNDGNLGTSESTAWKTFKNINRQALRGKTAILLKCGSEWNEQLNLEGPSNYNAQPAPADAINGLLIGAYGCSSGLVFPRFYGLKPLTVTPASTSTQWVYPVSAADKPLRVARLTSTSTRERLVVASHPDQRAGAHDPVYLQVGGVAADAASRKSVIVLDSDTATGATKVANSRERIVGATIHVKSRPWIVDTRTVTEYNAATREVTLSAPLSFPVDTTHAGYILEGLPWMLDQANEWVHVASATGGEIRLLKGSTTTAPKIYAGNLDAAIKLKYVKNVTVQRMYFENFPVDAIFADQTPNLSVKDSHFRFIAKRGVYIQGQGKDAPNRPELATVSDSFFMSPGTGAIEVRSVPGTQILNNYVMDGGEFGTLRGSPVVISVAGDSAASTNPARPSRIANNVVRNAPNVGIRSMTYNDVEIVGNTVLSFCEQFADCGGIYVGGPGPWMDLQDGSTTPARPVETVGRGGLISNNVVAGGASNYNGYFHSGNMRNQAIGIYLDETSNKVQVLQNVVSGTEIGIYLHDAFSNTIAHNTVRGVSHASIALKARRADKVLENNEIRDNVLFSHRSVTLPPLPATPTNDNQEIVGLREDKTVYAMKWESESINIADLFVGPRAHRVSGNQILTVRNGAQPVWRRQNSNVMADGGGALWFARNYAAGAGVDLGYADWLRLSGQTGSITDVLHAPLAYRQYSLALSGSLIVGGQPLDAAAWDFSADASVPLAQRGTFVMRSSPLCSPVCGEIKAGHAYDYLRSKAPFSVDHQPGNNLYVARYQARSVDAALPASLRLWASYSDAQGGLNIPGTLLPAGDFTQFEQFFRAKAPTGSVSGPDMKLYVRAIGNTNDPLLQRTAQFRELSVQKVTGITYRPDMSEISLNVVNVSSTNASTISLSQLNLPAGSTWVNESGQEIASLTLAPGQSAQIFRKDGGWLVAP